MGLGIGQVFFTQVLNRVNSGECLTLRDSHYILVLKFKDFSRTFKDPEVAFSRTNSRRKFAAYTELQQYLISFSVLTAQFQLIKHNMTIISKSCSRQNIYEVADIAQFDLVNSRKLKHLSCFQGLSRMRAKLRTVETVTDGRVHDVMCCLNDALSNTTEAASSHHL